MTRARTIFATLAFVALAVGSFQPFYLKVWRQDPAALRAFLTEMPYRKVPGLRRVCIEADRRIPRNARVLLITQHRSWPEGYDYTFRRAQYLMGRELMPMLGPRPATPPDYVVCIPSCGVVDGFHAIWRNPAGMLLERTR